MAYDLLLRRQTQTNWSRRSYCGPAARGSLFLAEYVFAPEPTLTTPDEQQMLAKLAVLKMRTDNGDKAALKQWRAEGLKILKAKRAADKGNPKAKRLITILNESGIFAGVQSVNV